MILLGKWEIYIAHSNQKFGNKKLMQQQFAPTTPTGKCFEIGVNSLDGVRVENQVTLLTTSLPKPQELGECDRKMCADFWLYLAAECAKQHTLYENNWDSKQSNENVVHLEIKTKRKTKKQLKQESSTPNSISKSAQNKSATKKRKSGDSGNTQPVAKQRKSESLQTIEN